MTRETLNRVEFIPVKIAIAVSESGRVNIAIADSNWIPDRRKYEELLSSIRNDKQLWSLRYVQTQVPYPVSSEKQL